MFFITLLDQFYWVASAFLGAAVGSVLPLSTEGVDFVMTAMFVVIFLNQWEEGTTALLRPHRSGGALCLPAGVWGGQLPHPVHGLHSGAAAGAAQAH